MGGSIEVVTKLLDSGADLHARDKVRTFLLSNYILGCIAAKFFSVFEFLLGWLTCTVFVKLLSLLVVKFIRVCCKNGLSDLVACPHSSLLLICKRYLLYGNTITKELKI